MFDSKTKYRSRERLGNKSGNKSWSNLRAASSGGTLASKKSKSIRQRSQQQDGITINLDATPMNSDGATDNSSSDSSHMAHMVRNKSQPSLAKKAVAHLAPNTQGSFSKTRRGTALMTSSYSPNKALITQINSNISNISHIASISSITNFPHNCHSCVTSNCSNNSPNSSNKSLATYLKYLALALLVSVVLFKLYSHQTTYSRRHGSDSIAFKQNELPLANLPKLPSEMGPQQGLSQAQASMIQDAIFKDSLRPDSAESADSPNNPDHSQQEPLAQDTFENEKNSKDHLINLPHAQNAIDSNEDLNNLQNDANAPNSDGTELGMEKNDAHATGGKELKIPALPAYEAFPFGWSRQDPEKKIYYLASVADMDEASKISSYTWHSFLQCIRLYFDYNQYRAEWSGVSSDASRAGLSSDPSVAESAASAAASAASEYSGLDAIAGQNGNDLVQVEFVAPPFLSRDEELNSEQRSGTSGTRGSKVANGTHYELISGLNEYGRGMELSELVRFGTRLLAFDDRTGTVYEISKQLRMIPRNVINEGDGNVDKGMKCEWATVVANDTLFVGSFGREYTNDAGDEVSKLAPLWAAKISGGQPGNAVKNVDWTEKFEAIRVATGTIFPGYLWIEAIEWSDFHKKWFVLPRYFSFDKYDAKLTEYRGANLLVKASFDFDEIELVWIKNLNSRNSDNSETTANAPNVPIAENIGNNENMEPLMDAEVREMEREEGREGSASEMENVGSVGSRRDLMFLTTDGLNENEKKRVFEKQDELKAKLDASDRGFSTMKFLPGTQDSVIVAIRTQEGRNEKNEPVTNSFLTVFDIDGNVLMNDVKFPGHYKYEGIEVI